MNEAEAGRFLAIAAVLDPKMPQPDADGFMRKVWARQLAEVPFEAADRAAQAYYSSERYLTHRETISPADVVQWWNARRRPNERERSGTSPMRALPRPQFDPQQLRDGVDQVLTVLAGKHTDTPEQEVAERRTARSIACAHCGADPGQPCFRSTRADGRVEMRNHHPSRVESARQAEAS